jgi:hypothetical protein
VVETTTMIRLAEEADSGDLEGMAEEISSKYDDEEIDSRDYVHSLQAIRLRGCG